MDTQPATTNYADGSKTTHEEQDEDRKWHWYAGGMVIYESKVHLVTVHQAFLVMDTFAWAEAHATAHEEAAGTATTEEARSLNKRVAYGLRRWLEGDPNYLEAGFPLWALVPAIAFRAKIGLLEVNSANFGEYMTRLMARTISARQSVPPAFILLADTERPCVWATGDASQMVDFAAAGVVTESVSQNQLWYNFQELVRAYEMASPDLGSADQDLSSADQAVKSKTSVKGKPLVKGQNHLKGESHAMAAVYAAWGTRREVGMSDLLVHDFLYSILAGTYEGPGEDDLDEWESVDETKAAKSAAQILQRHPGKRGKSNLGDKQDG